MKEQLISFDTAKLAKEKGFDWETEEFYTNPRKPYTTKGIEYMSDSYVRWWNWNSMPGNYPTKAEDVLCAAPTQSILQRWLEKTHTIFIDVYTDTNVNEIMGFQIYLKSWKFRPIKVDYVLDKYEGIEKGLQEALKLIK